MQAAASATHTDLAEPADRLLRSGVTTIRGLGDHDERGSAGLGGTTGQLTPGLSADPLVTTGDPLSDLANLGQLQLVSVRGQAATAAAK